MLTSRLLTIRFPNAVVLAVLVAAGPSASPQPVSTTRFSAAEPGEAVATITALCDRCDWGAAGREATALVLRLDGQYSQHLLLTRKGSSPYRIMLGPVGKGDHQLDIARDETRSAPHAGALLVSTVDVQVVLPGEAAYDTLAFAPILHERPNTSGRFSDTPLLMWAERDTTPAGRRLRYSVIFSNEDGGTPADKLMATWGRTTDIELVYDVALDATGSILKEDIQAPGHEILPFRGPRIGSHPLLWVVTDNNMVSDKGESTIRYAPAPIPFLLADRSREAVMDANPWTYEVMSAELARENKIAADARAGSGSIPHPRRFAYIEACGELSDAAAIAFDVGVVRDGRVEWFSTDREIPQFRVGRSGCFRTAAPLPEGVRLSHSPPGRLRTRVSRKVGDRDTPPPTGPVTATLRRVNLVFMLDETYRPGPSSVKWTGSLVVLPDTPREIPTR